MPALAEYIKDDASTSLQLHTVVRLYLQRLPYLCPNASILTHVLSMHISTIIGALVSSAAFVTCAPAAATTAVSCSTAAGSLGGQPMPAVTESNGIFHVDGDVRSFSSKSDACKDACFFQFKYKDFIGDANLLVAAAISSRTDRPPRLHWTTATSNTRIARMITEAVEVLVGRSPIRPKYISFWIRK
jgi:hypothetical protein